MTSFAGTSLGLVLSYFSIYHTLKRCQLVVVVGLFMYLFFRKKALHAWRFYLLLCRLQSPPPICAVPPSQRVERFPPRTVRPAECTGKYIDGRDQSEYEFLRCTEFPLLLSVCACKTRFLFRPPEKELPARRAATNLYQSYSVASMQQFPAGSRQFPAAFCRRYDLMVRSNMSVHQHQDTSSKHEDIRVHPFVCALCLVPSSMLRTFNQGLQNLCFISH